MKTRIEKTARSVLNDNGLWRELKTVCKANKTGRAFFIRDAVREAISAWIEINKI